MSKQFYTSTEAAEAIGLAPNTVNRRCSQGKIEASRDGFGTWIISADVVEAERQRIASKSNKMAPDKPRQHEPTPGYFTVEQAAAEIGLHVRTLARRAMVWPEIDPGRGEWPKEPGHTCQGKEEGGAVITIRAQETAISPIIVPSWRDSETRPGCRGCQHKRTKREARKVLFELGKRPLWGLYYDPADFNRFAARTRQRRRAQSIAGAYAAYPLTNGRFYVIHDQESEGGQPIGDDRTEVFNLLKPVVNDTPDDKRISTSGGWGGNWQGTKGDGRARQAKREGREYDGQIPGARRNGRVWEFSPEAVEHEKARLVGYQVAVPKPKPVTKPAAKAPAMTIKSTPKFTASNAAASDAELAANRARLAEIAKLARVAVYITADGRTKTVKRGKAKAR